MTIHGWNGLRNDEEERTSKGGGKRAMTFLSLVEKEYPHIFGKKDGNKAVKGKEREEDDGKDVAIILMDEREEEGEGERGRREEEWTLQSIQQLECE